MTLINLWADSMIGLAVGTIIAFMIHKYSPRIKITIKRNKINRES